MSPQSHTTTCPVLCAAAPGAVFLLYEYSSSSPALTGRSVINASCHTEGFQGLLETRETHRP